MTVKTHHAQSIFGVLYGLLANTHALYLQTLSCHWNVTGEHFHHYHLFFEEQYKWLADAMDQLAEQLRIQGEWVPVNDFSKDSTLEAIKPNLSASHMISHLMDSHQTIITELQKGIKFFDDKDDFSTADLLTQLLRQHEKTLWMLKSSMI